MKRNLFKKLSFIMALALVVTAMAPAATPAKAAANPSLNATSKTLYVGKSYNFNVKNKVKKSKYAWTSSDKKVATVNAKNGVAKAVAPGKATISCKVTLPTNKTKTLKATVTVKQDASAVAIKNPVSEVKVGDATYQFKRTITPKASTNKTFYVIDKESNTAGAVAVNDKGVINVANAGEFKIKAVAARGRAQFNAGTWRAESEWLTVKVPVEISAKLVAVNKVELTSNGEFEDIDASDIIIREKETQVRQPVRTVEKEGKVATLTLYNTLSNGKTYTVAIGEITTEFTTTIGNIASIAMEDKSILTGEATDISYKVFDANGLDVTANYPISSFSISNSSGLLDTNQKITLYNKGDITFIKLKYTSYTSEGKAETIESPEVKYTAVDVVIDKITSWYVNTDVENASYQHGYSTNQTTKVEDVSYLFIRFTNSDGEEKSTGEISSGPAQRGLNFESLDTSILGVDYTTGRLYPYKEGKADIKVTSSDGFVAYLTITVQAKRTAASLEVSTSSFTLSNADVDDSKDVTVTVKDQYGDTLLTADNNVKLSVVSGTQGIVYANNGSDIDIPSVNLNNDVDAGKLVKGKMTLTFKPTHNDTKSTAIRVSVGDFARVISINVVNPGNANGYVIDLDNTEIENYYNTGYGGKHQMLSFKVYEVDGAGIKRNVVSDGGYSSSATGQDAPKWDATYQVKKANGDLVELCDSAGDLLGDKTYNVSNLGNEIYARKKDNSQSFSTKEWLDPGTYTIEVKIGTMKRTATFTVTSGKPAATATLKQVNISASIGESIVDIVNKAVDVKVGGNSVGDLTSNIGNINFADKTIQSVEFTSYDTSKFDNTIKDTGTFTVRITKIEFDYKKDSYDARFTVNTSFNITVTVD